ncbi:MAG: 3-phosphoshikimate 1-carboxyvinyltransferase [Bacteroidetes bacterium]|nr:3-phosphoshikimate 1-carboxyvinyltransferase [Bacteroidota bacterium]
MKARVTPSTITGTITAPASKSSMQRACAASLIRKGETIIKNPGVSNDDLAAIDVIQKLGAVVTTLDNGDLHIISGGVNPASNTINCGESGLGIRMFTPITALSSDPITITGMGSLTTRPMHFFDEILPQIGVSITSDAGKLPLHIQGPIKPQNITVDGSLSSQFLTGLLMAYGGAGASDCTITVSNLKSKPYIDLTLAVMQHFGWNVSCINHEQFVFSAPNNALDHSTITYQVEGDWSGASFLLVAGAIAGGIVVEGLDPFSTQADKAVLQALIDCGCQISIQPTKIEIAPLPLKAFHFNATDCPDLFPPLVALASFCEGKTVIEGVGRLAHKESDRALTLQEEFGKLGVSIVLQDDLMIIEGGKGVRGGIVHSRHDHRIAMACAVAALKANGVVEIEDADAINKSYPNFYKDLSYLTATVDYK